MEQKVIEDICCELSKDLLGLQFRALPYYHRNINFPRKNLEDSENSINFAS